jgi:two-component system, NarL family, response regulator NreC
MNSRYRIVLVGKKTILQEGLRSLLSGEKDFEIVGEAEIGREAVRLVKETKPDLVICELSMHPIEGIDIIATIKKNNPNIKVAALTVHQNEECVVEVLKAGADGYILKEVSYSELVIGLRSILEGKRYLSPEIAEDLITGHLEKRKVKKWDIPWNILPRRQWEILRHIAEGLTNKQIADQLCLSVKTVEAHRSKIMKKLNVHNVSSLIKLAVEKGLIRQYRKSTAPKKLRLGKDNI